MPYDYGDTQEPGIVTDVTSDAAVSTSGDAPSDIGIVGQANLGGNVEQGSADPGTVYQVTRSSRAREWFGHEDNSLLTQAILDAFTEGAFPVYAVAPDAISVSGETHSGTSSTTLTLDEGPVREDADSISVTLDGDSLDVNVVLDDVASYSPTDTECYINPVYGKLEIPAVPSSELTIDYEHFDYPSAHSALAAGAGDVIDFLVTLNERQSVVDDARDTVDQMAGDYNLALLDAGADVHIPDVTSFENPYDSSRIQTVYPTRFADGSSVLGPFGGLRASLGLDTTPIRQQFTVDRSLIENLKRTDRSALIEANVVPLADESGGARVIDDPTTVSDENLDEQQLTFGFNRTVLDYVIETVRDNEQPFIGRLHKQSIRDTFEGLINEELAALRDSGVVLAYNVNVVPVDSTTARVEVALSLADPLRFVENQITLTDAA